ncbi:MAG: ABC transporter permease [Gordonibacter sp.]
MLDGRKETCETAAGADSVQSLKQSSPLRGFAAPRSKAEHVPEGETRLVDAAGPGCSKVAELPLLHAPRAARVGNRKLTLVAFVVALGALAAVVVAGVVATGGATATDFAAKNLAPSLAHPFGTDWMGRDMLLRTLSGLSTSVLVGLLAAGVSSVIALVLGAAAALGGKKVDAAVTWLIDLMMGVPHIVLLILISFALGKGFWGVTIGVAVTHWPSLARVVRAEILQCKQSTFVAAARKLGKSPVSIALTHMVPYVLPQFIVGVILLFPHAILHEAAVTFLGFGLPPEQPAIGVILSESMAYLSAGMWWLAVFPGLALIATVLLFDVAGSNLRKLVDPHSSQE